MVMNRKLLKTTMMCGAACVAPVGGTIVLPSAAHAQTVCAPSIGNTFECLEGVTTTATGTVNAGTIVANGPGLVAISPGALIGSVTGDIDTVLPATPAISLLSISDLTFDLIGTATTTGTGSDGAVLTSLGDIDATLDSVTTTGLGSDALVATATGDLNIVTDNIATVQDNSNGLVLTADSITAICGNVATQGDNSIGVIATAAAALDFTCTTVQTTGELSDGVVLSGTDITADLGAVTTDGIGSDAIVATATGDLNIVSDTVATLQNDSDGLVLTADNITAVCGSVTTAGNNSIGINATAAAALDLTCATVQTTGEASDGVVLSGTDITADLGTVTTDGIGSDAIVATATGDLDITSDTVATLQDDSGGLVLSAENITTICGSVTTAGNNSIGIDATATGSVDLQCASIGTGGNVSPGVDITAPGPITVIVGPVDTGGNDSPGVIIDGEDEPVSLTCGAIVTAGNNSPGVVVSADGQIDVNCESVLTDGDNSDGIQIDGGTGPVSVTVGPVTTDGIDSDGIDVITETGDQTIVAGPINVSGPGSDGISAVGTGCADINITATGDVLSADGTAILASTLCSVTVTTLPGASVTGADAGIDVTSGTGATITLNDSVQATDGPAINVDGAAAVINVNADGSIVGQIDLTDNDDTLNNGGTVDVIGTSDFGAGVDVINNLAGGTVSSTNGNGVLANCETFNNAGTVTMIDGAANDTLTICGNYIGTGAANLGIDVAGGGAGLTADQLIIIGNASGSTGVNLNLLPGSAVIDPDGVLIVDAGTSSSNPFNLIGPSSAGLINYSLLQSGADTFLVSTPDEVIFDFATMGQFAGETWYQSGDAHQSCAEARRNDFGLVNRSPLSVCGQVYYSQDRTGNGGQTRTVFDTPLTFSDRLKTKRYGAQLDVGYRPSDNLEFGLTGGYQHAKANLSSGSDLKSKGYNIGAYAEYGMATGMYAAFLVKHDINRLRFDNPLITERVRPKLRSTGVDGEAGWRTPAMGAMLDLNAGLSYVRNKIDSFDAGLIEFGKGRNESLRGRIGARLAWTTGLGPFIDAKILHEFDGDSRMTVGSGSLLDRLDGRGRGTWGRLEGGLAGGAGGGPLLSAWVNLGDVRGWGVRAGYRLGGSAAPMPLEPVVAAPPPPPAPPATQTCPDGSVILATDSCPLPPAPPPPPQPAPERG